MQERNWRSPIRSRRSKACAPLAAELGATVVGRCDVSESETIDAVFAEVEKLWGKLDFVVHCLAFSDKDQLDGRYVDTTLENFNQSLAISCFSFTAIAQRAEKLMTDGGSLLTLTYYGAEKWMPHYNVMASQRRLWKPRCAISPPTSA